MPNKEGVPNYLYTWNVEARALFCAIRSISHNSEHHKRAAHCHGYFQKHSDSAQMRHCVCFIDYLLKGGDKERQSDTEYDIAIFYLEYHPPDAPCMRSCIPPRL